MLKRLALLIFSTFFVFDGEAARTAVHNYTTNDGLPQAQVKTICQDGHGFLWVGTQAGGLGRYDGHRWLSFDASSGLPGATVNALALDSAGQLLVATSGGAVRLVEGVFLPLPTPGNPDRQPGVLSIHGDEQNRVYLGTQEGLYLSTDPRERAVLVPGPDFLVHAGITAITRDGAGGLWVGTTRGLASVAPSGPPRLAAVAGLPEGPVSALLHRAGLPLLVGITDVGLFEGGPGSFKRVGDDSAPGRRITSLLAEKGEPDAIWIGTSRMGAFRRRSSTWEPFNTGAGLLSPLVYSIHEDREGTLWFGTDNGLTKRGPSAFLTFDESDGFPAGGAIFGMAESRDGALWFSAWEAGLIRMSPDGTRRRFTAADGLPDERVTDTAADPKGGVFVGTRRGLARIDGDRVSLVPLPEGAPEKIRSLLSLPDGRLFIASSSQRMAILENGHVEIPGAPVGPTVSALFSARDGTVWCGGDGWGAVGLRNGKPAITLSKTEGLPSNQVTSGLEDSQGRLWIGTDRGVFCRDPKGTSRILNRRSGLPDSYVYWVGEDRQKGIWIGTNHGAARLDANGTVEVYSSRDGLGADECNEDGFFVDSRGRVFIATIGVSLYLGRPRPRRPVDPPADIGEVLVGGRTFPNFNGPTLPSGSGAITFRFAALSFTDEHAVRFVYRLRGLSEEWSETAPGQFETTYGGLDAGRYDFEVKAVTIDGRTSKVPASASFVIRPVWWRSRTAAIAFILLFGGTAFAFVRIREDRLVTKREELERQVSERTEELSRANERLAALAVTDELTGLANRRRILECLTEALAFARRRGTPLSIALADLDHFKAINDNMGHAEGDRSLFRAARAMQRVLRTEDVLGRYGGEEFLAVLPGTDEVGARAAAERMRGAVGELRIEVAGHRNEGGPSVSIGVASLNDPGIDAAELIRRADNALYRAKSLGRNRVEAAVGGEAAG